MHCVALHLNSFGCGRAEILARSTTYAESLFDLGIHTSIYAALHFYRIGGAMLRAVTALHAIACHNAPPAMKYSVTQLRHTLLLECQRQDCSRWAYLTTERAVVKTITLVVSHYGLHYTLQTILPHSWLQRVRGAFAHAQMTRRTLRL